LFGQIGFFPMVTEKQGVECVGRGVPGVY